MVMSWVERSTWVQWASRGEEISHVEEGGAESLRKAQKLHKGEMKQWETLRIFES